MTLLVVDANIMASALMGSTLPLLADRAAGGAVLLAPLPQLDETRAVLERRGIPAVEERMATLLEIVHPIEPIIYEASEQRAAERLEPNNRRDRPVLATALALGGAIWSHDRDFFGVGVAVWSNRNVRHAEAGA